MKLPPLSPLQFAILGLLLPRKKPGKQLREELAEHGIRRDGPAFYQLMSRMEDSKWVKGWYEQQIIDDQIIRERWYQVLGAGVKAFEETRDFYSQHAGEVLGVRHA